MSASNEITDEEIIRQLAEESDGLLPPLPFQIATRFGIGNGRAAIVHDRSLELLTRRALELFPKATG